MNSNHKKYPQSRKPAGRIQKTIEISERISQKWAIIPKRWVVERTFSWLNGYRRLAKDFEISISSAQNYVMLAHSMLLLKRVA
jgi:putative transposase